MILSVRDLTVRYGAVHAVNNVSFDVARGETLAIVGESGSGKTSTGHAVLRLREPTSGQITYDGIDVRALDPTALRRWRRRVQLVFQDPYASLNPRMSVGAIVREGLEIHRLARGAAADDRVKSLLSEVGLDPSYT